jgi:hypothetical protein
LEADLHPQAFGQILTRIWQLLRAHLKLFIALGLPPAGLAVAFYAVVLAVAVGTAQFFHQPFGAAGMAAIVAGSVVGLAGLVALMTAVALYQAAASYTALQVHAGMSVTVREAYGAVWPKAGRYLWLAILRQLVVGGPIVLPVLVFMAFSLRTVVAGGDTSSGIAMVGIFLAALLYLAAMVWAILALLRLVLAYPACVAEDIPAWAAIRRSNRLTRGGRLRIFLVGLVLYAITYGVMLACELVFGIILGIGMIPILVFHLGPAWSIPGAVVLGICFVCALVVLGLAISSSYSIAFAILYREHLRLESAAAAAPSPAV